MLNILSYQISESAKHNAVLFRDNACYVTEWGCLTCLQIKQTHMFFRLNTC